MKLVNLDGLALVGPGSEWFWSMLQFVVVTVTLYAIYRQIRLQSASAAIEQAAALQHDLALVRAIDAQSPRDPRGAS